MSLPHDLTHQDWHALLHVALGQGTPIISDGPALARLSQLYLIEKIEDGPLRPTTLGRSAIIAGSPELWSR